MSPRVEWHGDRLVAAAQQAAIEVARMHAEVVSEEMVNRCPVESSQTRNSKTVTELKNGAEVSFNTPQAAWLHESQGYTPSHAGTGPNYARGPLLETEDQYHKDVAAAMKAIFG
ncbi:hypothetical protein M0R72_17120 [Candidatus Pacearchaeota archaeon]|jgi:hypothetical protein|nr:hypothetical protein [Candidatus Pacearchaeota archaeon]